MPSLCCPAGHLWDSPLTATGEPQLPRCPRCDQPGTLWPSNQALTVGLDGERDRAATASCDTPLGPPDTSRGLGSTAELPHIAGYEMLAVLDAGGMGIVYRARHVRLDLTVALKMIRRGSAAGPQELLRFHREARAVASLNHPGIVRLFDFGEHDGLPYFSMELVEGGSLADRLREGPLTVAEAVWLVEESARAMHHVHEKGIVHRDLKPGNVLLASGGREPPVAAPETGGSRPPLAHCMPKIADFGLARTQSDDKGLTETGMILGTASYVAPEQARGVKPIGPAVDVYALGAILYAALTGQPPFQAETRELTLLQVLSGDPKRPSLLSRDVPPEIDAICLKCLEKDPTLRYSTALALADDLAAFRQGAPLSVSASSPMDWHARWARGIGFELLDVIGSGRTGFLYQARQISLDRIVALKLLPEEAIGNADAQACFRAEAAAIARLHHPHIVQIHDFGERLGQPYFTVEYVDGGALSKVFTEGAMPARQAAQLVATVARAIHYAHARGVIHCGLRPASVLMTSYGHPKISRFGVARVLGEDRQHRRARDGRMPGYLAPEQVLQDEVGPATDVHGLGGLLYALLTGQAPFPGKTLDVIREAVLNRMPPAPRTLVAEIPAELEAICLQCLAKNPQDRPASALSVAEQLDPFSWR